MGIRQWSGPPRLLPIIATIYLKLFKGTVQVGRKDRRRADKVEVTFRVRKTDSMLVGVSIFRTAEKTGTVTRERPPRL